MGKKEQGLLTGSIIFLGIFVVTAILLGQYVFIRTKDTTQKADNRK